MPFNSEHLIQLLLPCEDNFFSKAVQYISFLLGSLCVLSCYFKLTQIWRLNNHLGKSANQREITLSSVSQPEWLWWGLSL